MKAFQVLKRDIDECAAHSQKTRKTYAVETCIPVAAVGEAMK